MSGKKHKTIGYLSRNFSPDTRDQKLPCLDACHYINKTQMFLLCNVKYMYQYSAADL